MGMITLGIDLSSQSKNTVACRVDWLEGYFGHVAAPELVCNDAKLDDLIGNSAAIGIDAPFGWPLAFRAAVSDWTHTTWTGSSEFQESLRLRATDRATRVRLKSHGIHQIPLSVSTDRIALPAMRAMALLKRHGVTDKSGDGRFYEVYPAGSLGCWNLPCRGYKNGSGAADQRRKILAGLRRKFPNLRIPQGFSNNDHALDALIAAISAKLAKDGDTTGPDLSQQEAARTEGWIHLPKPPF